MKRKKEGLPAVTSLCFGTYAEALRLTMMEPYDGQKALTDLLLFFIIDKKNLKDKLGNPLSVTDKMASELFGFKSDIHQAIKRASASQSVANISKKYFDEHVSPCIIKNLTDDLLMRLRKIISVDVNIPDKKKDEMLALANKETLADFLSTVFLYALQKPNKLSEAKKNVNANGSYFKKAIWEASKREYLESRSEGSRFANLNIISNLLPHGYIVNTDFTEYGKNENGMILPLQDILDEYVMNNVSIIGEGGIGKTTFLLKLMEKAFEAEYDEKMAVPIFIELNRCPAQVGEWYAAKSQKTNFITRYIAAQMTLCEIEEAPSDILALIEGELHKKGNHKNPEYLILLDGFNEVNRSAAIGKDGASVGSSIREMLNNEIKALMRSHNIRIITTSRKMDMVYFSGKTKNVELTGVKVEDIEKHLRDNHYSEIDIKWIKSSRKLMDCLRIPLFLCMFTAGGVTAEYKPVTRGEILYSFFNRSNGMYNEKMNAGRINAQSSLDKTQVLFILDFVLPYIGWTMEYTDFFYYGKHDLYETINNFFEAKEDDVSLWNKKVIAFPEYETEARNLNDIKVSLSWIGSGAILDCIVNMLGIMYHDKRFKYYFIHHHIRDYFAGMYEIQLMRLAVSYKDEFLESKSSVLITDAFSALSLLNENNWSETKQMFIGEIVCEHRNAPVMSETGKWKLPEVLYPEQLLLKAILDVFRYAQRTVNCGVYNIIETMKKVRGNLAGENFSRLDLRQCRFHEVTCSVGRNENMLAADFKGSIIADDTFGIEGHYGDIIEFAYSKLGDELFTISDDGMVKRWEVETGKCLNTIKLMGWERFQDEEPNNNFVISADEEHFLVRGFLHDMNSESGTCFAQEYSFSDNKHTIYTCNKKFSMIHSMRYSFDNSLISVVFAPDTGENYLYLYQRGNPEPIYDIKLEGSDNIFMATVISTGEVLLLSYDEKNFTDIADEDSVVETECHIGLLNVKTNNIELLYSYFAEIDLQFSAIPIFCMNRRGDKVAFFEANTIKEFHADTHEITSVVYKYTDRPLYMNYLTSDNDLVLIVYGDAVILYSLRDGHEAALYKHEELNFQVYGQCCGDKLLLFDEMLDAYEWDLVTTIIQRKYRHHELLITNISSNLTETEIVLSFDNESIVIIDTETGKLKDSIYYGECDSKIGLFLYDRLRESMVMLLENDSYEYVKYYDVPSCSYKRTYFDFVDKQKIQGIETSEKAERLLCCFDKMVAEIDLKTLALSNVYSVIENEKILSAHYLHDYELIQVVLCGKSSNDNTLIGTPYIYEFKESGIGCYRKVAMYRPPFIPHKLSGYYIPGLFGTYGFDNNGQNPYLCINSGIFIDWNADLNTALSVKKQVWDDTGNEIIVDWIPQMGEINYVCYDQSFAPERKLLNISDDNETAVILDGKRLVVLKLIGNKYEEINDWKLNEEHLEECTADNKNLLFCVNDENEVFSLDLITRVKRKYPSYIPGLVVIGCDFRDAKLSDTVRNMLELHGSIIN